MRRTVVGVIAVVTASSVFSLVGLGTASAVPLAQHMSSVAAFSPVSEAATFKALHDALASAWQAKDANAMQATQAGLATELAKLQTPQGRHAMAADAVTTASKATEQNNELGQDLATLLAQHGGKSAGDLPLPGLGSLMSLIQSLLATILSLVTGLLGGLPLPVGLPALPVGAPPAGH